MNVVLRENITGVRVIRAFNKEPHEKKRMRKSFTDYAEAAIKTNRLFAALDSLSFFAINLCIVLILWLGGNQIGLGNMPVLPHYGTDGHHSAAPRSCLPAPSGSGFEA